METVKSLKGKDSGMMIQFDTKKWKFDPKFWAAMLALFGVTNFGELVDWARGRFFRSGEIEKAVALETRARQAADSVMLHRLDTMANQMGAVVISQRRQESALKLTQEYLLQVPQVRAYDRVRVREDSLRRERDRIRRSYFERDARGPGPTDRTYR